MHTHTDMHPHTDVTGLQNSDRFGSQTELITDTARGKGEWKINKGDKLSNRDNTDRFC